LCEIYDTLEHPDGWFGRVNIFLSGDLLKLDSVIDPSPFVNMTKERFSGLHPTNLW